MNISNKLTVFRIFLVPIIVFFLTLKIIPYRFTCAFVIFLIASYTDHLDGKIARKNGTITAFGAIMDPLADKILISSVLICFSGERLISALAVVIIVAREFIVTSIRLLILESKSNVIPANTLGKLKTISQMIAISVIFATCSGAEIVGSFSQFEFFTAIGNALIWLASILSVASACVYIYSSRKDIQFD